MITFSDFLLEEKENPVEEEITEQDIDSMIENLKWEDIEDLYTEDDFDKDISEAISAAERIRRGQKMRARKSILAMQRRIKLKRTSSMPVLKRRSQIAARKLITQRLLRKREKSKLSPSEKSMIELRVKRILKMYKNLPARLVPKIREIERSRLSRQT
jgi:hypothetical protein